MDNILDRLDSIEKHILKEIADIEKTPIGAFNIRENGKAIAKNVTANIDIIPNTKLAIDNPFSIFLFFFC